jgi:hypothetical protein
MICPYLVNTKKVIKITKKYNDDGQVAEHKETEDISTQGAECIKTECGAWYNGRCQYKG